MKINTSWYQTMITNIHLLTRKASSIHNKIPIMCHIFQNYKTQMVAITEYIYILMICNFSINEWFNVFTKIIQQTIFVWKSEASLHIQYIPRNMHAVFALLCFVVVIHWLIFPYPSGLLHWHCGNLTIAPVPAKQPWWIWINTSCEFIMNDCITTTKQSTTKPCAYFLGYTVPALGT